jgi:hypothetical protein
MQAMDKILRRERQNLIRTISSSPKHVASRLDRKIASQKVQKDAEGLIEEQRREFARTAQAVRQQLVDGEKLFAVGKVVEAAAAFTRAQELSNSCNGVTVSVPIRHRLETRVKQSRLLSRGSVGAPLLQGRREVMAWQDVDPEMDDCTVLAAILKERDEGVAFATNTPVVATPEVAADQMNVT